MSINNIEIWKEHISECKASGLQVTEWCQKNGFTKAKYYYWHKIIAQSAMPPEKEPIFAEIQVPIQSSSCYGIKISCKDVDIALSHEDDIGLAVQFVRELQKQC